MVWTDTLQIVFMFAGFLSIIVEGAIHFDGFDTVLDRYVWRIKDLDVASLLIQYIKYCIFVSLQMSIKICSLFYSYFMRSKDRCKST